MPRGVYTRRHLTPEEQAALVERVRTAYEAGQTQAEIAISEGLSPTIILRLMHRNGIKTRAGGPNKPSPISRDDLQRLYCDERLTTAQIGERYGVSDGCIEYWMKKYGIRSRRVLGPFEEYVNIVPSGCHEWTGAIYKVGYGNYRGKYTHRLAYERAKGPIPKGLYVCHACDNKLCVNPDHLWLGTAKDNWDDAKAKGRLPTGPWVKGWASDNRGSNNGCSKLDEEKVREIRRLRGKVNRSRLAARYGVTPTAIYEIHLRKTWRHI